MKTASVLLFVAILAVPAVVLTETVPSLDTTKSRCHDTVQTLDKESKTRERWASIVLVVGASTAAVGSALAGFLKRDGTRKTSAVIGALGAVLAIFPKILDTSDIDKRLTAAAPHLSMGDKVFDQIPLAPNEATKKAWIAYASARYHDCDALFPGDVPLFTADPKKGIDDFYAMQVPSEPSEVIEDEVLPTAQNEAMRQAGEEAAVLAVSRAAAEEEARRAASMAAETEMPPAPATPVKHPNSHWGPARCFKTR